MRSLILLAVLASAALSVHSEPTWTSLRVTWGLNVLSSRVFAKIPMSAQAARSDGFVQVADTCEGGKFRGHRYMKGVDTTAVPIYDANGHIAGMQHGIPVSYARNVNGDIRYDRIAAYQHDKILGEEEVYFITTYFVDPRIICSGRSKEEWEEQGVGVGVWVQNGTDPIRDSVQIPLYENATEDTLWKKGGCFRTMGQHYWWGATEDMDCGRFFPLTAIYNRGKLTSYAFVSPGKFEFSRRFEHPPESTLTTFMPDPIPKCVPVEFERAGGFSTMHVFFSLRPWNVLC